MLDSEWFVVIISLVMWLFHSQSEILTYAEENSWKHIPNNIVSAGIRVQIM